MMEWNRWPKVRDQEPAETEKAVRRRFRKDNPNRIHCLRPLGGNRTSMWILRSSALHKSVCDIVRRHSVATKIESEL
jgi:hypothetical protein